MSIKPKILLTGGTGMVGKNILEHSLADKFYFLSPTSAELNLRDFSSVEKYISHHSPEFIIHAAGMVGGIQANIANPVDFLVHNTDLGRNVILAARNAGIKKVLNLSSSCMYPREAPNPLAEDLILKGELEPTNEGYALAKIFTLRLCEYVHKEDPTFQYKTFIPCNLYGRFDKFNPKHSHLIPAIIHKVYQAKKLNEKTVEIWGDGTVRREFMYAGDLADAIFKAVLSFERVPYLMNLGIGTDYSINDYYQAVAKTVGWDGQFIYDLTKPVGMKQKMVSIERQKIWGWSPTTPLEDGIKKSFDFYLNI